MWRSHWVALVVLLRTVGHVLKKVDARSDPVLGKIVEDHWQYINARKEIHPLFWKFIEEERNNILKTFDVRVKVSAHTYRTANDRGLTYHQLVEKYGESFDLMFGEHEEDALYIAQMAHEWWDDQLRVIEVAWHQEILNPFTGDKIWDLLNMSFELDRGARR